MGYRRYRAPLCVPASILRAEDNRIAAAAHDSGKVVGGAETQTDGRTDGLNERERERKSMIMYINDTTTAER